VFYYVKEKLEKMSGVTALNATIAINEFFNFSYEYIVSSVLSPKMLAEICQDIYENGMHVSAMDFAKTYKMF